MNQNQFINQQFRVIENTYGNNGNSFNMGQQNIMSQNQQNGLQNVHLNAQQMQQNNMSNFHQQPLQGNSNIDRGNGGYNYSTATNLSNQNQSNVMQTQGKVQGQDLNQSTNINVNPNMNANMNINNQNQKVQQNNYMDLPKIKQDEVTKIQIRSSGINSLGYSDNQQ
jgi:hypothetical protein